MSANLEAGYKLSRVLADPRTSPETRNELMHAIREFSMSSDITVEHPALARRAFLLMCEAKPKGRVRECRHDRKWLLDLLADVPEGGAA